MKKFLLLVFLIFETQVNALEIQDYFDNFYQNYLCAREISPSDREILDYLKDISNSKVSALEKILFDENMPDYGDRVIAQIDEEFFDFLENINFEISQTENCPLSKKQERKIKKAHKKFICHLYKNYKHRFD